MEARFTEEGTQHKHEEKPQRWSTQGILIILVFIAIQKVPFGRECERERGIGERDSHIVREKDRFVISKFTMGPFMQRERESVFQRGGVRIFGLIFNAC